MDILDFYARSSSGVAIILEGSITVSVEEGIKVIAGDNKFKEFIEGETEKGVLSFPNSEGVIRILLPKDGKDFIDRLLVRYSGSRFWAHLRS